MDYRELMERYDFLKSGKGKGGHGTSQYNVSYDWGTRAVDSLKKGNVEAFLVRSCITRLVDRYSYHVEVFSDEDSGMKYAKEPYWSTEAGYENSWGLYNDDANPFWFEGATGDKQDIVDVKLSTRDIRKEGDSVKVTLRNTAGNTKTLETRLEEIRQ